MTAHSPVGLAPEKYKVKKVNDDIGTFANNDIEHVDLVGANHEIFGFGLKKALFNYMHGACFDMPLQKWFEFKIPKTTIAPDYILKAINEPDLHASSYSKVIWMGVSPSTSIIQKSKKGNKWEEMSMHFHTNKTEVVISIDPEKGNWFLQLLPLLSIEKTNGLSYAQIKENYLSAGLEGFELFWDNKPITSLYKVGLLSV
jgi:hypothetical protein